MKVRVGYITSWRRTIFFCVVLSIVIFGTVSTLSNHLIGLGLVSNIISVGALVLCICLFVLVLADKFNRYEGIGSFEISNGHFGYKDKKRHYDIDLKEISKIDIEPIVIGQQGGNPIAYRVLIQTGKKKRYIESERARGAKYNEVDLYQLYIKLQENRG